MAVADTAKYKYRTFPSFDELGRGGLVKYCLSSWNAFLHSSFQVKTCFRVLKKGKNLFVALETNLLSIAILLDSF